MKTTVLGIFGLIIMVYGFLLVIAASDSRNYMSNDRIPFGWGQTITLDAPVVASFVGCEYFLATDSHGTVIEGVEQSKEDIPLGWPCAKRYIMENVSLPLGTYKTYEGENTTATIINGNPAMIIRAETSNFLVRLFIAFCVFILGGLMVLPLADRHLFEVK